MNKKKTKMRLCKTEHIRCHLWQIYYVAIYKVKMATVTSNIVQIKCQTSAIWEKAWNYVNYRCSSFLYETQKFGAASCSSVQLRAVWSTLVQTCASYKIDIQSMIVNRMLDKIIQITLNGNFCHELRNNQSLYTFYKK